MHPTEIPTKIIPHTPEDGVELPVDTPTIENSAKELAALASDLNMTQVNDKIILRMRAAGLALDNIGSIKTGRAGLYLTEHALLHANSKLLGALDRVADTDDKKKLDLAYGIGYLAEKLMRLNKEMREGADASEGGPAKPKKKSFAVGAVVQQNAKNIINVQRREQLAEHS